MNDCFVHLRLFLSKITKYIIYAAILIVSIYIFFNYVNYLDVAIESNHFISHEYYTSKGKHCNYISLDIMITFRIVAYIPITRTGNSVEFCRHGSCDIHSGLTHIIERHLVAFSVFCRIRCLVVFIFVTTRRPCQRHRDALTFVCNNNINL